MIYQEPLLTDKDLAVIALIEKLRAELSLYTRGLPRRWMGSLRRLSMAKAIQGSNSIEGIDASLDEAVAAVDREPPLDPGSERFMALIGYQNAMTYVMQSAKDPEVILTKQFFKALHFMMTSYSMDNNPGQFRPGSVFVFRERDNQQVYDAPDRELVDGLMEELVAYMNSDYQVDNYGLSMVRGAMAHLNLTLIRPFSDGNGRMARVVQTFVLAQESGVIDPIFASIEEWLGDNTPAYYAALAEMNQGKWSPEIDAHPWLMFCLRAHYAAATKVKRRYAEYGELFHQIKDAVTELKVPSRALSPMFDVALGLTISNAIYSRMTEQQPHTSTRDLNYLVEKGFLVAKGVGRGRVYTRSDTLAKLRATTRVRGEIPDPYALVSDAAKGARLPGL